MLAGSTRLRAGTATKLVLNMISTAVMIRLGHVYGNLMVNVQPTNRKLTERARRIIRQATGVSPERAAELLTIGGNSVRTAIIMEKTRVSRDEAERLLAQAGGRIREAVGIYLDKFEIQGGAPLAGEIAVSGAKNSALPALAACLLTADPVVLERIPPVRDIHTMEKLLEHAGARVTVEGERVTVEAGAIENAEAPYDLVKTMRASSLVLGPLVARCGRARVSVPGGCAIGARPINLHVAGLEQLGAHGPPGARLHRSGSAARSAKAPRCISTASR